MIPFKKAIHLVSAAILILGSSDTIYAANNSVVQSAQWLMSGGARSAETEDADTPMLNPAGAVLMEEGTHFHLSVAKVNDDTEYTNQDTGEEYNRMTDSWLYPLTAVTYNSGNWAGFFTITIPGTSGGGTFDDNGHGLQDYAAEQASLAMSQTIIAENKSYEYYGALVALTLGGSIKISDSISIAYAIRQLNAISEVEAKADLIMEDSGATLYTLELDQKRTGTGIGHTVGIDISLGEDMNIGIHYESEVPITVTAEVGDNDNSGIEDGAEDDENLAAKFQIGLGLGLSENLQLDANFEYFFKKGIKQLPGEDYTKKYENALAASLALEYQLTESLELGVAYRASAGGIPDEARTFIYMNDRTTYQFFGLGAAYRPTSNSKIVLSGGKYFWKAGYTPNDEMGEFKVQQDTTMMGLGFELRI